MALENRAFTNIPSVVAASLNTPLEAPQISQINRLALMVETNKKLNSLPEDAARKEFAKLTPDLQKSLDAWWGQPKYSADLHPAEDKPWYEQLREGVQGVLASPFKLLAHAAEGYGRTLNTAYSMLGLTIKKNISPDDWFKTDTWKAAWNGRTLYDQKSWERMVNHYGKEKSFIAAKILEGKTFGEIIDEWGSLDNEFVDALAEAQDPKSGFEYVIDDFESAKLSPGREYVRLLNGTPVPGRSDEIFYGKKYSIFGAEVKVGGTSGGIDALFQILADPLTYVGIGIPLKGFRMLKEMKQLKKTGDRSLIATMFADPTVKASWDEIGRRVTELNSLSKSKDLDATVRAAAIRSSIKQDFPALNSNTKIKLLQDLEITDAQRASDVFTKELDDFWKITTGRLDNTTFQRDGLAVAKSKRVLKEGLSESVIARQFGRQDVDADALRRTEEALADFATAEANHVVSKLDRLKFLDRLSRMAERHPGGSPIVFDGDVTGSLQTVYAYARQLLPKGLAKATTELFANASADKRLLIIRGLYVGIMEKMGLPHVVGGEEVMEEILNVKFGNIGTMGVESTLKVPAAMKLGENGIPRLIQESNPLDPERIKVSGALHPFQFAKAITGLPFDQILSSVAGKGRNPNATRRLTTAQIIGGLTEHVAVRSLQNTWTVLTLFPKLGIRSAIDEAMMHTLDAPYKSLYAAATGEGRKIVKIFSALEGSHENLGPITNWIRHLAGRDPAKLVSAEKRVALNVKATEIALKQKISSEEIYKSLLFEEVWSRYGRRLPVEYHDVLLSIWKHRPDFLHGAKSNVVHTAFGSARSDRMLMDALRVDSVIAQAVKKAGGEFKEVYGTFDAGTIAKKYGEDKLALAHFHELFLRFVNNTLKIESGLKDTPDTFLNLGDIFIRNNGLQTTSDWSKAEAEALSKIGIKRTGGFLGVCNRRTLMNYLRNFGSNGEYLKIGNSIGFGATAGSIIRGLENAPDELLVEMGRTHIFNAFTDTYQAFHGSSSGWNGKLVRDIQRRHRENVGSSYQDVIKSITPDEFYDLTEGHRITGQLNTSIDFAGATPEAWYKRFPNDMMGAMERQVNSIVRAPGVAIYAVHEKLAFRKLEEAHIQNLMSEHGYTREQAKELADKAFTELATDSAIDKVLKYADNPNIRTNAAYSLKTVGRFYRATEDFYRRLYRLSTSAGAQAIYRTRLMHQGLESSGFLYQDQNGEEYITIPGDNIIFSSLAHTLNIIHGKSDVISQPRFSDFSMKLSAISPSLTQQAGVPTFAGPLASIGVLTVQGMLKKFGPNGQIAADNLDNLALGDLGDNLTLWKALVPSSVGRIWKMISRDDVLLNTASAMQQAISHMHANGQIVQRDGKPLTVDSSPQDINFALKNIRIATKNILVLREATNLISPASVSMVESVDVPDYLKRNGIPTLRAEFMDIVRSTREKYGDVVDDPYELALNIWMRKNPGRAVYSVGKTDKSNRVRMEYVEPLKNWMINNKKNVETYGDAALIFSPRIGEFSQASYNYLESHGYLTDRSIEDYLFDTLTIVDREKFYTLRDEMKLKLEGTVNFEIQKAIKAHYTNEMNIIKASNPILAAEINGQSKYDLPTADVIFGKLKQLLVDDVDFVSKEQKTKFRQAVRIVDQTLAVIENPNVKNDLGEWGYSIRQDYKMNALRDLKALQKDDPAMQEAYRVIFQPLINRAMPDRFRTGGAR